jgi:hypothetical protein
MTTQEETEALIKRLWTLHRSGVVGNATLEVIFGTCANALEDLLSSSAAASGVREALETIQSAYEDQNLSHRDFRILAGTTAAEAINGEQNG